MVDIPAKTIPVMVIMQMPMIQQTITVATIRSRLRLVIFHASFFLNSKEKQIPVIFIIASKKNKNKA
jgi:hypothetical protein